MESEEKDLPDGCGGTEIENEQLQTVFQIVKEKTGQDISSYKENTLFRRIQRRMATNDVSDLELYLGLLKQNPLEASELCRDILIGVTSFFRDPQAFAALGKEVIPRLLNGRNPEDPVRIWHAGCATGEEAYSTAIMFREFLDEKKLPNTVLLFASDLNENAIARARSGCFSREQTGSIDTRRLQSFFMEQDGHFRVEKSLRDMIVFAHHNLLKDPPFSRLDLVVCRNILIYLNPDIQNRLVALFHQALKPGGFLFLGSAETVGKHSDLFSPLDNKWKIFQRLETDNRPDTFLNFATSMPQLSAKPRLSLSPSKGRTELRVSVEKLLLERYSPPCVLVNDRYEVTYFSGRTSPFLELPAGEPSRDILKMVRAELRPLLRAAIHKAFSGKKPVMFRGLRTGEKEVCTVNLLVEPLSISTATSPLAMVVFEPLPATVAKPAEENPLSGDGSSKDKLASHLEEQLRFTREQLQATIEQLETSNDGFMATNEELIALNEEFQSTNEELQSTNEELETSKEELQAFNEELATINAELQRKIEELDRSNSDMENLFASSEIATIFLDPQLTIKRFSPAMARVFDLISADIGRSFRPLAGLSNWAGFARDAAAVMESGSPIQREVSLSGRGHYLMRVLPYRTSEGSIDGIVATLVDITERKKTEEQIRNVALFPEENPSPVLRVADDGRLLYANRAASKLLEHWHVSAGGPVPESVRENVTLALESEAKRELEIHCGGSDLAFMLVPIPERRYVNFYGHDITDRNRGQQALREKESALREAQEAARIGSYIYDIPADTWNSSEMLDRIFGIDLLFPRTAEGWSQLIHPDNRQEMLSYLENCIEKHRHFDIEYRIIRPLDGEERWVWGLGQVEYGEDGQPQRMAGTIQDITARKRAEAEILLRNRAMDASSNAIVICNARNPSLPILYVNPAFERITGIPTEEVLGRKTLSILGKDLEKKAMVDLAATLRRHDEAEMEIRSHRKDGTLLWAKLSLAPVRDDKGKVTHVVAIIDDITDRKIYEEKLEHQANHDALTGLANRHLLTDRLGQGLIYAGRSKRVVAVLLLDLDRFKVVNDSLGHSYGDQLLGRVAERLGKCVRPGDTVCRLGGDEFVIALADIAELNDVGLMAKRIRDCLAEPFSLAGHDLRVTASMGISLFPKDGGNVEDLICHADIAMYRAKEEGGDTFRFFAPEMNLRVQGTLKLEAELRLALERGEFLLHYQPKVDFASGTIIGCEALVRWQHPERGLVSPGVFIPLAEETGLIVPLGLWVLREACMQARAWQDAGLAPLQISVNLSARQFRQVDLIDQVRQILELARLSPESLELEITESMIMHEPAKAVETMRQLKAIGVGLCLDDFGTGYSSLNYLRRFPVDFLKIDRSFILDVASDQSDAAVARSIVAIAHSLGIGAVAEGVETWEQFDFLAETRCDALQGFLFSQPLSPGDFAFLLKEKRTLKRN